MSTSPDSLTPRHVRAARALLAWSQQDLAKAACIATSTIADFERGKRTPIAHNAHVIRSVLEAAGIRFLPTGAVVGPPLPLNGTADHAGTPVRWVSAADLSQWADRIDGAVSLPTLIAHLIRATHGSAVQLHFPSDEAVRQRGWDGLTTTDTSSVYVPGGSTGWELTAQRTKILQKADEDYRKRTAAPLPLDPAHSAFIFVTLRHWAEKDAWVSGRRNEGPWREVRAYDGTDLVHWIEQAPAVGLWLAARLGKRPPGTRELEEMWEEWSLATRWPLTKDLVLSDRDQDSAEILRWLRGAPSVLSLQATSTDEVVAFFHATLSELPDDLQAAYRARVLVATTAAAARALATASALLILVLTDPDPGLARSLAERGHYVLMAYDGRPVTRGEIRALARPSREGIASALTAMGISEPRAEALSRDSARNLAVLRRLLAAAPGRLPQWAREPPPQAVLAALLAGGWYEDASADRAQLSAIANQPYETVIADLTRYIGQFDSPLRKIGAAWRIASPIDAWFLLAPVLTGVDIGRFEAAAHAVLGSPDPRFAIDPDERWMAVVRGIHRGHSGLLRHGIGQMLIMLALWGDRVHAVPNAGQRAEAVVRELLRNADQRRWWSLSGDFRLLAEASPDAFLTAIENSLDQNDPPIGALFGRGEGGPVETEYLADLMRALESLAWSPDWMPRVSHVLARLDAIDIKPRRHINGPANSLRKIHLLWTPQTCASLDQRLRALDLLRKREPCAAWKLMLDILPRGYDSSFRSATPRWRDFPDNMESVTWDQIQRGAAAISQRVLDDVGLSARRWSSLLDCFGDLADSSTFVLEALEAAEPQITAKADRAILWRRLRQLLHHHRRYPDARGALPDTVLDRLGTVYDRFAPADPLERTVWLFEQSVPWPKPSTPGWEAEQRDVAAARQQAARTLFAEGGRSTILALARLTDIPSYIGQALIDSGLPAPDLDALVEAAVRSDDIRERALAHGMIVSVFRDRKAPWAAALIDRAQAECWGDTALLTILGAFPITRWTWDQVVKLGDEIEKAYWSRVEVFWIDENGENTGYAIRKLIDVGRARCAVPMAGRAGHGALPSALLVDVLRQCALQQSGGNCDGNGATMFQHDVAEILQVLDTRCDVKPDALIEIEWKYLQVLEHGRRPPVALLKALSEQPALFVKMVSAIFPPNEECGVVDPNSVDQDQTHAVAMQAYRMLKLWNHIPGMRDDGVIDGGTLETWIKEARKLAKEASREDIADRQIGDMLSSSPLGADGNWPAEPVREVIELFCSKSMIEGFRIGRSNRRGITIRMPRDGGELERQEATRYRMWATAIRYDHPHIAKALDSLADDYDREAHREDEAAERLDWSF